MKEKVTKKIADNQSGKEVAESKAQKALHQKSYNGYWWILASIVLIVPMPVLMAYFCFKFIKARSIIKSPEGFNNALLAIYQKTQRKKQFFLTLIFTAFVAFYPVLDVALGYSSLSSYVAVLFVAVFMVYSFVSWNKAVQEYCHLNPKKDGK